MSESAPPPTVDPSLQAGAALQTPEISPNILQLATDPKQMSETDRQNALNEAMSISSQANLSGKVIVEDDAGNPRWGSEFPTVFSFNHMIRSNVEHVEADWDKNSPELQTLLALGAAKTKYDHVIVETDDGEQYMIRRTSQDVTDRSQGADEQTFDITSTTQERGQADQELTRRELDGSLLAEAVIVPGQRMLLGGTTEKPLKTRGMVTKITAFDSKTAIAANHPVLNPNSRSARPRSEAIAGFNEALEQSRAATAPEIGKTALKSELTPNEPDAELPQKTLSDLMGELNQADPEGTEFVLDNDALKLLEGLVGFCEKALAGRVRELGDSWERFNAARQQIKDGTSQAMLESSNEVTATSTVTNPDGTAVVKVPESVKTAAALEHQVAVVKDLLARIEQNPGRGIDPKMAKRYSHFLGEMQNTAKSALANI